MTTIYLTEQNSVLRKRGKRLIVQKENEILLSVPCHKIDNVLIFGNVQFTTQAVTEMLDNGIELAILSRTGNLRGKITSPAAKNIELRIRQFEKFQDEKFRLDFSREIVAGKITNSLNFIRQFSYKHPEISFQKETEDLKKTLGNVISEKNADRLLGLEGNAAKVYFGAFGKMMRGEFVFAGRKKRPPTDPVNAMLSLSYTLVFNEISAVLEGVGLDPYLGYFHKPDYGRASLASDIVEEFRSPVADKLVRYLVRKQIFRKSDFYINFENNGVYFMQEAQKRYFAEYEKMLNQEFVHPETSEKTTFRKCFRIQAEKTVSVIQHDEPYNPFVLNI
jgi:CRISPR-associated protein Cas1